MTFIEALQELGERRNAGIFRRSEEYGCGYRLRGPSLRLMFCNPRGGTIGAAAPPLEDLLAEDWEVRTFIRVPYKLRSSGMAASWRQQQEL